MNNPKFDFYTRLHAFLTSKALDEHLLKEVVELYGTDGCISVPDVTPENLVKWHECLHREPESSQTMTMGEWTEGFDIFEQLTEWEFQDLAPQMRNKAVRILHKKYKKMAEIPTDLFIRLRRVKPLGDGVAVITFVVDDATEFKRFIENQEAFSTDSEYHYSEEGDTEELKDEASEA